MRGLKQLQAHGLTNPDVSYTQVFSKKTFTITEDAYLGFRINCAGPQGEVNIPYNQTYNIQIEEGTGATTFEEYRAVTKNLNLGDIELCKIDTYQDYIYKNNGNWYKKEIITKQVLSDLTGWNKGTPYNRFFAEKSGQCVSTIVPYCDYLQGCLISSIINAGGLAFQNLTSSIRFNCYIQAFYNDLTAFNNWLASAKPVCYYANANATDIQITDATLIEQLESLLDTIIPNGTIVVSADSDSNNADLQVFASTVRNKEV